MIRSTFVILLLLSENTTSSCVFMHAPGINHLLQILLYDICKIVNVKVKCCDINFWPQCCFLLFATFPGHKYVFLDIGSLSTNTSLTFLCGHSFHVASTFCFVLVKAGTSRSPKEKSSFYPFNECTGKENGVDVLSFGEFLRLKGPLIRFFFPIILYHI